MIFSIVNFTEASTVIIVNVGVILLLGFVFGKIAEKFRLPAITGYLIAGLILGPITHFLTIDETDSLKIVSDIALGFIAFQVGNELWFGKLKKTGKNIAIITIVQALTTTSVVFLSLLLFTNISVALILGAIAAATAPAPIMMLINKYKTKGELTDTIVPIVGLDDAVGVILFSVLLSLGVNLAGSNSSGIGVEIILEPLLEIGLSIVIGVLVGLISGLAIKTITNNVERREKNLDVIIITVFVSTGLALLLGGSSILTPMIAGMVVTNLINKDTYILENENIRFFIPTIMIAFFTIAGAELQFGVVFSAGLIGISYIIARSIGKIFGSYLGTSIVKSSPKVKKYLGVGMLPQSGVAIGLSIAAFNAGDNKRRNSSTCLYLS
jgi:Kef-type K+ transport system membrane component KefB